MGVSTFDQIWGHFELTPIFLVASKENGLQNSSKPSITKLIEARITKGVTKTSRNKMPEGINVGRTGHHLQSLKFYINLILTLQSRGMKSQVNKTGYYVWSPIQIVTSANRA